MCAIASLEAEQWNGGTSGVELVEWAYQTSCGLLAEVLPRRWAHVQSVADEAKRIARVVDQDADLLVAAAILHDIGYAPDVAVTGFHPLDGARYLASVGAERRLCCLVARHSCALREAEMRGLESDLEQFADEFSATRDALWYCDMVSGPDGQRVRLEDRLREIQRRYGAADLVSRFIQEAHGELNAAVERTTERMRAAGID